VAVRESQVLDALRAVQDPDLHRDIVSLGFIEDLKIDGDIVAFTISLTTPACPVKEDLERQAREAVLALGVRRVDILMTSRVRGAKSAPAGKQEIPGVAHIVAVGSGKGGVGKSTVAVNLAVSLARQGARVGLLDADVYGPNVPVMMGIAHERPMQQAGKILPLEAYGVRIISMGVLVEPDTALIWRGPMLHGVIQNFTRDVAWGELDYLLVDLPPGTGDVQLSLVQSVPLTGAVIVATPQRVALDDAGKAIAMFRKVEVPILGLVENMSYFLCPSCDTRHEIFAHGGARARAEELGIPVLGEVPLVASVRAGGDAGRPVTAAAPDSAEARAFAGIAEQLAARISIQTVGAASL